MDWEDLLLSLRNANHFASVLELSEISEKIQDIEEEVIKERKLRFR